MPPEPRLATPADLPAIEAIVHGAYAPFIDRIGQMPAPMLDDYRALVDAGHVTVIAADGRVAALLVLVPEGEVMLLDNIAVAPRDQGKGLGRVLMTHAERVATGLGCRAIRLYTNAAMTENIGLYGRIGYTETHRAEEKGLKRVYMTKALA